MLRVAVRTINAVLSSLECNTHLTEVREWKVRMIQEKVREKVNVENSRVFFFSYLLPLNDGTQTSHKKETKTEKRGEKKLDHASFNEIFGNRL